MKNNAEKLIDIFYQYYDELARRAFMIIHDDSSVNDVMQEVAATLIEKQDELLNKVEHWRAFLHTCVKNTSINMYHKNQRTQLYDTDSIDWIQLHQSFAKDEIKDSETIQFILSCIKPYTPELREAFLKYILSKHPLGDLANSLNMSPNALAQQFKRMKTKIAEIYLLSTIFFILFRG